MAPQRTPITVILPARNDAENLSRCLTELAKQDHPGPVRIVVVPNGCTDETSDIARSFTDRLPSNYSILIHDVSQQSKACALNAGDRFALPGIRVYLDADSVLSPNSLRLMHDTLQSDGINLCAPRRVIRRSSKFITRCYSKVWSALPYVNDSIICSGVYAVSATGRSRWTEFPLIHSDDKFVRLHFRSDEWHRIEEAYSVVGMPDGTRRLFRARVRWCRGNRELARHYPSLIQQDQNRYAGIVRRILGCPKLWGDIPLYAALHVSASLVARLSPRANQHRWNR